MPATQSPALHYATSGQFLSLRERIAELRRWEKDPDPLVRMTKSPHVRGFELVRHTAGGDALIEPFTVLESKTVFWGSLLYECDRLADRRIRVHEDTGFVYHDYWLDTETWSTTILADGQGSGLRACEADWAGKKLHLFSAREVSGVRCARVDPEVMPVLASIIKGIFE